MVSMTAVNGEPISKVILSVVPVFPVSHSQVSAFSLFSISEVGRCNPLVSHTIVVRFSAKCPTITKPIKTKTVYFTT